MCRMSALAATAVALSLAPMAGWAKDKPAKPQPAAAAPTDKAAKPEPRKKATPEQRAMAQRSDALTRAAFWTREVEVDAADEAAGLGLAQALRALGSYEDAANAANRLLLAKPDSVEALLELARIHVARGQGFYAVEPARKAQALAPRDWRIPSLLGVAYEQASRDDEAVAAHRQALALAPDNASAMSNLAMFYASHGDKAQAESLLRRAAALPGATVQVRQNLALVLGLQGRLAEAEKLARQDLPPEVVSNNMAYLRAAHGQAPDGGASTRSWNALTAQP
jgi:Flp pilus assembly protein TadD